MSGPPRGGAWSRLSTPLKAGIIVGGVVLLYFGYKKYEANKAAAATNATTTGTSSTGGCPSGYQDDGTGNCVPIGSSSGWASGSGGGGGGGYLPGDASGMLNGVTPTQLDPQNPGPQATYVPGNLPADTSTVSTTAGVGTQPILPPRIINTTGDTGTPIARGVAGNFGNITSNLPQFLKPQAGSFVLPKGTVRFDPTAAIRQGNVVYYGVGNPSVANQLRAAGGTLVSGKQVPGGNPGALYLKR